MSARPEYISKLAIYLMDKEPLIYLFIINSDFIEDNNLPFSASAGVSYKNRRVLFYYNKEMLSNMTAEELYFLVLHEAYHIFKKHLQRHGKLKSHLLANIAEDMVINEEVKTSHYGYGLRPKCPLTGAAIPEKFKQEHRNIGKDAYVTERIYHWLINQKINKKDLLQVGSYVHIKDTDKYGRIESITGNGKYRVNEMSKEEMIDEINNGNKNKGNIGKYSEDELIPVVFGQKSGEGIPCDFDVESIGQMDEHFDVSEESKEDAEVFARKIVKQAQEIEKHSKIIKMAGNSSESFLSKIESLLKSKVNWKKELKRRINMFHSDSCGEMGRKKSIINYMWNPKSRYGILYKHDIESLIKKQAYIIFAVDTSGSCFYDKYEMESFFTEVESVSKELSYTKKGKILTIQWDTRVKEGLKIYRKNDWKKFNVRGGGGTDPKCVFRYLQKVYKKQNGWYTINENGVRFVIDNKRKLPLLIFLTDGYFFSGLTEKSLLTYKTNKQNVLYFTRKTDMIYPKKNYILYQN